MAKNSQQAYGITQPLLGVFPAPIIALRAPTTSDTNYQLGQVWIYTTTGQIYMLASVVASSATWSILGPGASDIDTITGNTGGALSPAAGNINILGNATQGVSTSGAGSTLTIVVADATDTQKGVSELATNAEAVTGTDAIRTITPASLTARLAAPGPIGGTTPGAGTFTNLTALGTINLNATGAGVTTIGSITGASGIAMSVGTGNFSLATAATSTIAIGSAAQTGAITLGQSTAGQTVNISSAINTGAQIVSIANGAAAADSTVNILSGNATAGTQTLNLAQGTGGKTVNIATSAGVNLVVIGSTTGASSTTINAGSGKINLVGNVALTGAATQLQIEGGAVTDFIGQATLTAGVVTVANTNIAAGDKIFISRSSINGSTALGMFTYTISAGASFTITSVDPATPANTETNDVSIVEYVIIRQL